MAASSTLIITMTDLALLRLLQLVSPALPVGAYAYSQGLEYAVDCGWVRDEATAGDWIQGLLEHGLACLDAPVLVRLHAAWTANDRAAVQHWNAELYAARETRELRLEDRQLGIALARLLGELGVPEAVAWRDAPQVCFATLFALAASRWDVGVQETLTGYLWAWSENQVMAATKLIPLGQTAGQRLLSRLQPGIARVAAAALQLTDDDIGGSLPGLAYASSRHETQYTRLFRS